MKQLIARYQEPPDWDAMAMSAAPETEFEEPQWVEHEYHGDVQESQAILKRIRNAVVAWEREHKKRPETIVLGRQDYLAVDALVTSETHRAESVEDVIEPEIVTVPGRMIHVPQPKQKALITALKEQPEP